MNAARTIEFTLNGRKESAIIETHWNLVELLGRFGLGGARESCGQGLCGCCTVLLDGVAVSGCLYLAVAADGKAISTVESLDENGTLSPVQQAFIDSGAFQCGFCTPGFVLMTHQLLEQKPDPSPTPAKTRSGTISRAISAAARHIPRSSRRCARLPRR
jgi:aerobic-type carbon monoxide dehydrogenase small subunit (CoxS/CutS family)